MSPRTREKARRLNQDGHVHRLTPLTATPVIFDVRGHTVRLDVTTGDTACTCRATVDCSHTLAAVRAAVNEAHAGAAIA